MRSMISPVTHDRRSYTVIKKTLLLSALATVAITGAAQARDQINIVGSSTVYPFATVVAERFGKSTKFSTPKIESTGSGGGLKLFCAGVGVEHPDITNASRRIKKSEVDSCAKNGVKEITEVKIGYDGIVVANSKKGPLAKFTRAQLFLALAKQVPAGGKDGGKLVANPFKKWSDIDSSLPNEKIEVLGPPPTSGTRDAFSELVMEEGCEHFKASLKGLDKKAVKAACQGIREDGAYIEAGENDNLIVQKLDANPVAFGVFGYSFLEQNADKIQGSVVDGITPTFENISAQKYPVSRPLFFYVKKAHVGQIPGIKEYVAAFTDEKAWGPDGYLTDRGLIPLPDAERKKIHAEAADMSNLSM
jgi:phosphate transport system substrate-binding protein